MFIKLTDDPIKSEEALLIVRHPSCGAVVTFEGNIRAENEGKRVCPESDAPCEGTKTRAADTTY